MWGGATKSDNVEVSSSAITAKISKNKVLEIIQQYGFNNPGPDGNIPPKLTRISRIKDGT